MPFEDETFHYLYTEHMIEHVPYDAACSMLRERPDGLRPGGRIRVATPDLEQLVRLYADRRDLASDQAGYVDFIAQRYFGGDRAHPCSSLNNAFSAWGHQFLFDEDTLRSALVAPDPPMCNATRSPRATTPIFRGLEAHDSSLGNATANEFETLVLEAERPRHSPSRAGGDARFRAASPEGGSSTTSRQSW